MKIYITRSNSDMIEGRGPMEHRVAFLHREDAAAYIDNKPGCMGRRRKWSVEKYGDWDIVEIEVLEGPYDESAEKRRAALAKLTPEEIKILGFEK